ncbi:MAG: hypothetical protein ACD_79C00479G0001, partial [uncultured bacterium]
ASSSDFIDGMIASGLNGAMFEVNEILNEDGTLTLSGLSMQNKASDALTFRSSYEEMLVENVSASLELNDVLSYANNAWSALSQEADYVMQSNE